MFEVIEDQKANRSGTGLGLYISKQIAKELSYEGAEGLCVKSKINKGTTFSFILEEKQPS